MYKNVYKYDSKYNIVDNQTGTSFGVPIVGGIVALLLQQVPDFTQDEIRGKHRQKDTEDLKIIDESHAKGEIDDDTRDFLCSYFADF